MSLANVIQDLVVRIRYVSDREGLERSRSAIAGLRSDLRSLVNVAGLALIGRTAWKTAADLEAAEAQFTTMLGSASAAKNMMKEMWDYAAMSTFEMRDVTHAMTTMLSYGMGQEQSLDTMKRLGDVAGASGPKFQRLALAMAQMQAKTRLTGEEVRQFVNAGWNPLRQVADMFFKGNMAEAEEQMRKRKVSAEMVFAALKKVTDEGGRFYGNQIRQSQTLTGVFTTMKDRIKMTLAQMLMAFSTPIKAIMRFVGLLNFDTVIKGIQEMSLWLQAAWQWFVQMTDGGSRLGFLSEAFGDLRDQIRDLIRSKEFGVLILWIVQTLGVVLYILARVIQAGTLGAARLVQGFRMLLRVIMFIQGFFMFLVRWLASAPAAFQPMWEAILDVFELVDYYGNKMVEWLGAVDGWVASIVEFLKTAVQFVMDLLNDLDSWLANTLGLAKLDAAVLEILNKLWEGMTGGFDGAMDYVMKKLMASVEFVMRVIGFVSDWVDKRTGIITAGKRVVTTAGSGVTSMMQDLKAGWENAGREVNFSRDELIKSAMASQTGMATDTVKRTVEAGKTTTNINNKTDFKVDVKGDPNAKTGLTAGEVAMLAEQAARATFSIGLEQALEATI